MELNSNERYSALMKDAIVLPEAQKLDDKTVNKIKDAISKAEDPQKEYQATRAQLQEYPWLKNASFGIRKVSDIIEDFKNGIDGSQDYSITSHSQDNFLILDDENKRTHAYNIYGQETQTTSHLPYDDENHTRNGETRTTNIDFHVSYYSKEVNEFKEIHLNLDVKDSDKTVNFDTLYDRLKSDKDFEQTFISSLEEHLYENDSSQLIGQIKKVLDMEEATLTPKDPSNSFIYTMLGKLNSHEKESVGLNIRV